MREPYARLNRGLHRTDGPLALRIQSIDWTLHLPWVSALLDTNLFTVRGRIPRLYTKEVIRLQVPLQPPCYDFSPLAEPRFDRPKLEPASPKPNSGEATGGVCKEQGRIHRAVMTRGY